MSSRKYQFRLEEVEPFRYRATDAYKAVTGIAIRESRLKEIKSEIFNNKKLKVGAAHNDTIGLFYISSLFRVSSITIRMT